MYELCGVDVRAKNDYSIRASIRNGNLEVANWLVSVCPSYHVKTRKGKVYFEIEKKFFDCKGKQKVEEVVDCCICYGQSDIVLGCNHQYCKKCIMGIHVTNFMNFTDEEIKNCCSLCRQEIVDVFMIDKK
jgi:hypothetical protein